MTRPIRLIVLAALMTGFLAGMVAMHAQARRSGTEIRLAMEPVDPRDILLGHYVQLMTPLHRLDTRDFDVDSEGWEAGDSVYVRIEPDQNGAWQPVAIHRGDAYPALTSSAAVLVHGQVRHAYTTRDFSDREVVPQDGGEPYTVPEPVEGSEHTILSVVYNIERYYADQESALALERMRNEDRLRLIVSVGEDGSTVIKGLEIDGETHYDSLF